MVPDLLRVVNSKWEAQPSFGYPSQICQSQLNANGQRLPQQKRCWSLSLSLTVSHILEVQQIVPTNICNIRFTAQRHCRIEFLADHVECGCHARFTHRA